VDLDSDVGVPLEQGRWLKLCMQNEGEPTHDDVERLRTAWGIHGVWAEPRLEA
jgi:hypothetical protein